MMAYPTLTESEEIRTGWWSETRLPLSVVHADVVANDHQAPDYPARHVPSYYHQGYQRAYAPRPTPPRRPAYVGQFCMWPQQTTYSLPEPPVLAPRPPTHPPSFHYATPDEAAYIATLVETHRRAGYPVGEIDADLGIRRLGDEIAVFQDWGFSGTVTIQGHPPDTPKIINGDTVNE